MLGVVLQVVTSMWFERVVLTLIAFNCVVMAMESPDLNDKDDWATFFRISNLAFVIVFALEFLVKVQNTDSFIYSVPEQPEYILFDFTISTFWNS